MANLYISEEYLKRLQKTENQEALKLASKFRADRKIAHTKPKARKITNKTSDTASVHHITDEEWERIKKNAERISKERVRKEPNSRQEMNRLVQKYDANKKKYAKKIKKKKVKPIEIKVPSPHRAKYDSDRPLYNPSNRDMYDFAGEYQSRNVEFGHGRKKSLEWRGVKESGKGGSINRRNSLLKSDPNVFDRQAMK